MPLRFPPSFAPAAFLAASACVVSPPGPAERIPDAPTSPPATVSLEVREAKAPRPLPPPPPPPATTALETVCWSFVLDDHRAPGRPPRLSLHAKFENPAKLAGSDAVYVAESDLEGVVARAEVAIRARVGRPSPTSVYGPFAPRYEQLAARCWSIRTEYQRDRAGGAPYAMVVRFDVAGELTSRSATAEGESLEAAAAAAMAAIRDATRTPLAAAARGPSDPVAPAAPARR